MASRADRTPLAPLAFAVAAGVVVGSARSAAWMGTFAWSVSAVASAGVAVAAMSRRSPSPRPPGRSWRRSDRPGRRPGIITGGPTWPTDDLARAPWPPGDRRAGLGPRGAGRGLDVPRRGTTGRADRGATRTVLALTGINDGRGWRAGFGAGPGLRIVGDRSDLEAGPGGRGGGPAGSAIEGPLNPGEVDFRPILRARGIRLRLAVDEPSGIWPDPLGATTGPGRDVSARSGPGAARQLSSGLDPEGRAAGAGAPARAAGGGRPGSERRLRHDRDDAPAGDLGAAFAGARPWPWGRCVRGPGAGPEARRMAW